ncbi:uncharacterized protein LOC117821960 [Xyrichtys novacula]|uniref:Uncharacterized protein LOC117821960 n=1 Tax=Xyrichtys novacula TaxID=13765 RepID=A0AAV1FY90_XYRNO|nr:uncharacterized protein LOC117821960 [Xyrichtys novacula]
MEAGGETTSTWKWYGMMDATLRAQHSISPPLVVAANLTATTGGVVTSPSSAPPREGAPLPKKRAKIGEELLKFMKEQAERDEEREREAVAREEARERAAAERAER